MKYHKRSAIQLADLVTMSPDQYTKVWKEPNDKNLQALRRYYIKKLGKVNMEKEPSTVGEKVAQLLERSGIDPANIQRINRVNVWQSARATEEDSWDVVDLVGVQYTPVADETQQFVTQAQPVKVERDRRKPVKRDFHRIFDFPDLQLDFRETPQGVIPTHNEAALRTARMICRDVRPQTIVVGGDNLDMAAFSKFDKDSTHFDSATNLQNALDALHTQLALIRGENPDARVVLLEGNHDYRMRRDILKTNSKIAGVRPANMKESWPVLSLPSLLHLDDLEIEWVGGYPAGEFVYSDTLIFIHGKEARSGGSTAELYSKRHPLTNIVFHHIHRQELHTATDRNGNYRTACTFGCLCSTEGAVSSYGNGVDDRGNVVKHQENWQNGVGIIDDYGNGNYQFTPILIKDGRAHHNGKVYDGNETIA